MDAAYDFLTEDYDPSTNDRTVTPESLAWNLVMGEEISDFGGVMQKFVSDENGDTQADRYQQLADEFQILISTYMEMVFNILKTNFMGSLVDDTGDLRPGVDLKYELDNFKPNFREYTIDDMATLFKDRLAKIRYLLNVRDITSTCEDDPNDYGFDDKYYCKILLLDDERGTTKTYFRNAQHIPPNKRYTFLIRQDDVQKQDKLEDFYAVAYLPGHNDDRKPRKIRVSFSRINVIVQNPHLAP